MWIILMGNGLSGKSRMNITVYCGASLGSDSAYQAAAKKLGKWIADSQHTLVYGGGKLGLMGVVADTVLAHQSKVIGIIPQFLQDREVSHPNLTKTVIVESMSERKNKMVELGMLILLCLADQAL